MRHVLWLLVLIPLAASAGGFNDEPIELPEPTREDAQDEKIARIGAGMTSLRRDVYELRYSACALEVLQRAAVVRVLANVKVHTADESARETIQQFIDIHVEPPRNCGHLYLRVTPEP